MHHYIESIIVKCIPDIPEHISIDENNNIHINVIHRTTLKDLLNKDFIKYISLNKSGEQIISLDIPISNLLVRKYQIFKFSNMGIPKINNKDMYSIKIRSNIIIHLELFYE